MQLIRSSTQLKPSKTTPLLPPLGPLYPDDLNIPFGEQLFGEIGRRYSRVHLNRLIQRGHFPPPVRISPNSIGWKLRELRAWRRRRPRWTGPCAIHEAPNQT